MVDAQVHVVIDNGTGYMKGGFSGENAPRSIFPTLVGTPNKGKLLTDEKIPRIIGQEALEKMGMSDVKAPIEKGIIKDWDDMELIWHHMLYNELRIAPEDHNMILTDIPSNSPENREKMVQRMFEKLNVPGLYISMTSVLAIYDAGRTSGMAVDSGEVITNFVPVYEGFAFPNAISKSETGGRILTDYLILLLTDKKYNINTAAKKLKINDIKEKYCRVSYDFENEIREAGEGGNLEEKVKLPDGEELTLETERLKCPEALFRPNFLNLPESNMKGLHDECCASIQQIDVEIRKDLYSNIILSGGNTMFEGLPERLTKEIQKLTPSAASNKVKVIALPERKYATWIGASILSSLSNFQCMWITRAEYKETGESIVHKKCL
jgi:actin-related protein